MASGEDALIVLRSIDANLKELLAIAKATAPKPIASDRDLDSKYGDPELKFIPRDWTGVDYRGSHLSACPPTLLDLVAETFDYFAGQAEAKNELASNGKPVAPYKRADAARARGWAKRMRNGWMAPEPQKPGSAEPDPFGAEPDITEDDIPF